MSTDPSAVTIVLRIPGAWSGPEELVSRLPEGVTLTPDKLVLEDGSEYEINPRPPDDQFADIFFTSCRQPPTREERSIVNRKTVILCLAGPGGSMESALSIMRAGAAIIHAGGGGVFNDNSGLAHGGSAWCDMADDGSSDAVSYAFAGLIHGGQATYTVGMHCMGFPDLLLRNGDGLDDDDGDTLVTTLRYLASGMKPIGTGHVIVDETGNGFRCTADPGDPLLAGSPMHNPFGRLRLVPIQSIAEGN
jgi:hypothetical protein